MLELFKHAGIVAYPLAAFSVIGLAIMLERLYTLFRLKQLEERAFMMLQLGLEKDDEGILRDPQIAAAPVTQVVTPLASMRGASEESLQEAAGIGLGLQRVRLRRYLGTLATFGSTSPFIGLFGTVLGVMAAFQAMSRSSLSGEQMSKGISEALSATALGLLVAIPAVMFYNYLLGRVHAMMLQIQGHVARLIPLLHAPTPDREEARRA